MTLAEPRCPKCQAEYTYADGSLWVCPQCSHEWAQQSAAEAKTETPADETIRDANGNALTDGDSVTIIKDLKVKGASGSLKVGTKVKSIRLVPGSPDGHNITCKIDGFGAMNLKSEFVKKSG
jgi:protein PhnA